MREIVSFFISISHLFYSSQTLTTLNLGLNQVGAKGAQAIGQALERNQVREIVSFFISTSHLFYWPPWLSGYVNAYPQGTVFKPQ